MMVVETLTLLSTLPTLCSTPVATSAMPAWREALHEVLLGRGQFSMRLVPGRDLFPQLQGALGDAVLEVVVGVLQCGVSPL